MSVSASETPSDLSLDPPDRRATSLPAGHWRNTLRWGAGPVGRIHGDNSAHDRGEWKRIFEVIPGRHGLVQQLPAERHLCGDPRAS